MAKYIFTPNKIDDLKTAYDAVIVGSGGTGLTAALQAHELGLKVAVFEKNENLGGNTNRASSGMTAAVIGAVANTTRLSLVDYAHFPAALAAFIGALIAGLLASVVRNKVGFPRIALTVPSIVIMVPGLYMYRGIFNFGITNINIGAFWLVEAIMIVAALPLGLLGARILTDKKWRHVDL